MVLTVSEEEMFEGSFIRILGIDSLGRWYIRYLRGDFKGTVKEYLELLSLGGGTYGF